MPARKKVAAKKAAKKPPTKAKKAARPAKDGVERMDPTVKKLWVAALRSGEYKQGEGTLCQVDGDNQPITYCCLGVLCKLSRKYWEYDYGSLPNSVMKWAKLEESDPVVLDKELSTWNDSGTASFKRIATMIEKHL